MNQRRWVPDSKSRALRVPRARNFVLCRWTPGDGHRFAHSRSQRQKKRKWARLRRRQEKNNSVKCASPALRWSARAAPSNNFGGRFFHASTAMMLAFLVSCVDRTDQLPDGRQTLPWDYCRVAREIGEIGLVPLDAVMHHARAAVVRRHKDWWLTSGRTRTHPGRHLVHVGVFNVSLTSPTLQKIRSLHHGLPSLYPCLHGTFRSVPDLSSLHRQAKG